MVSMMNIYGALLQIPGIEAPDFTLMERIERAWEGAGIMAWPLGICAAGGVIVIIWKAFDLMSKSASTKKILTDVDELLAQHRIKEALELTRESNSPAANILYAGLERHEEGTQRVMKAIENQGLVELSRLESGLVIMATLTNVAPLLGFLGTVMGMIVAFESIELAGEVEATLVAGGIKIALLTTAFGLGIAIPVSMAHNMYVATIDGLVIDIEESAQKMIDAVYAMEAGRSNA